MKRFVIQHRDSIKFAIIVILLVIFLIQHSLMHEELDLLQQEVANHLR